MSIDPRVSLMALSEADARGAGMSAALTYVGEAFALAALDGVEPQDLAEAALCAAMCELVAVHGEDEAARIAKRLADRTASGEFSVGPRQ
jgi:hypothetical protein